MNYTALDKVTKWGATVNRIVMQVQKETGKAVPAPLVMAVMHAESGGDPRVKSTRGAYGLMQLMPVTAKEMRVNRLAPEQNILGGVRYIAKMLRMFDDSVTLSIAAYNAGPGNVRKYHGIPPFPETVHYVKKVLTLIRIYSGGKE